MNLFINLINGKEQRLANNIFGSNHALYMHVLLVISDIVMLFKYLVTRIFTKNKEMSFVCFAYVLEER